MRKTDLLPAHFQPSAARRRVWHVASGYGKLLSGKEFRQYAGMIDLAARKGVTGNQDTAEHHAIVITGIQPGELDREERLVYTLVVGRMLETFMPPCKVEYTTVEAVCAARKFRIRTYRILEAGWLGIFQRERLVAEDNDLCPVPLNFSGGEAAGNGMQPYTQEIAARCPLYG